MRRLIKITDKYYLNLTTTLKVLKNIDIEIYPEVLDNPNYKEDSPYNECVKTLDMVTIKIRKDQFNVTGGIFAKHGYPTGHISKTDDVYEYLSVDYIDFSRVIYRLEEANLVKVVSIIQPRDIDKKYEKNLLPMYINPKGIWQNTYSIIYTLFQLLNEKINLKKSEEK